MSKSRSCREYLILTDDIIVLEHIFNLTKKSNLIGRLYYDLTRYFHNLGVTYFLGHPVGLHIFIYISTCSECCLVKNQFNPIHNFSSSFASDAQLFDVLSDTIQWTRPFV